MKSKFTGGKWLKGWSMDGSKITFSHPSSALTPIADVWACGVGREEAEANANLIESAQDLVARLLEARNIIKALIAQCEQSGIDVDESLYLDFQREACDTIAKAKGQL